MDVLSVNSENIELLKKEALLTNGDLKLHIEQSTVDDKKKAYDDDDDDEIISISVSGRRFQTLRSTLARFPASLLGNDVSRAKLKRNANGEIFLDRNHKAFEALLTFYQTGIFEEPTGLNLNIFKNEIRYYGLVEEAIESGIKGLDAAPQISHKRRWQEILWNALEEPQSSVLARIITIFSLVIILLSVIVFCLETIPSVKNSSSNTMASLDGLEKFCIAYFTLEFLLRMLAAPNKLRFFWDFLNIIDLLAIVPFYITLATNFQGRISIYFLRTLRLIRVFRIFKLSRYSGEMKILGKALTDSARELGILVFFIVLGVILFSSAVYYADASDAESQFKSIPGAFWWSIVTMTTVGYGDEVPKTVVGRLVGAACAMCGILVIAMPIPIIVNNFTRQYSRLEPVSKFWKRVREEEEERMKKEEHEEVVRTMVPLKKQLDSYDVNILEDNFQTTNVF
eukprot:gene5694-6395_t